MFKHIQKAMSGISLKYLIITALFLMLGMATDIIVLIYDGVLLTSVTEEGVSTKEFWLNLIVFTASGFLLACIVRAILDKREKFQTPQDTPGK